MIEKVAVPFWVCWSAGLVIALYAGHAGLWLGGSAAVGIVLGLGLRARAVRRRRIGRPIAAEAQPAQAPAPPPAELDQAA